MCVRVCLLQMVENNVYLSVHVGWIGERERERDDVVVMYGQVGECHAIIMAYVKS